MDRKSLTKPIRIAFVARAGGKLRIPKVPMTEPIKIAFIGRLKKPKLHHTEGGKR